MNSIEKRISVPLLFVGSIFLFLVIFLPAVTHAASPNQYKKTTIADPSGLKNGLTLTQEGLPVMVYSGPNSSGIFIAFCQETTCATVETKTIDESSNIGSLDIAMTADGKPAVAYVDTDNILHLAVCSDEQCTSTESSIVNTSVSGYISLAYTTSNTPVISYKDSENSYLYLIQCTTATCSTTESIGYPLVLDNSGNVFDTTLALDTNDYPNVVYGVDNENGGDDVRFVHCSAADCTTYTSVTLQSSESEDIVLSGTRVILNGDGLPWITYLKQNKTEEKNITTLNFVQCSSMTCADHTASVVHSVNLKLTKSTNDNYKGINSVEMAVGANGKPLLSFVQQRAIQIDGGIVLKPTLKLARCKNTKCTLRKIDRISKKRESMTKYHGLQVMNGVPVLSYVRTLDGGEGKLIFAKKK